MMDVSAPTLSEIRTARERLGELVVETPVWWWRGREITEQMDAELSFRVTDTSLDPYVRAFQPQFSPFTTAVASGAIRVVGELYNPDALRIDVEFPHAA